MSLQRVHQQFAQMRCGFAPGFAVSSISSSITGFAVMTAAFAVASVSSPAVCRHVDAATVTSQAVCTKHDAATRSLKVVCRHLALLQ